jgi:molybdenum cofactor synthesis domain-containing protein
MNELQPLDLLPVSDALGRILAAPVVAQRSVPHFAAAAVDGVAVRADQVEGAAPESPVRLVLGPEAYPVNTGHPIPPGFNAVVMREELAWAPDGLSVLLHQPTRPGKHIRAVGEDAAAGQPLFPAGHRLRPVDLGALLTVGVTEVQVWRQPLVGFIPTGSELVEPGNADLPPGQITESNSAMVLGEVVGWGGQPRRHPIVLDDRTALREAVSTLIDQVDLVLISAGSSQGSEDYTVHVLRELGEVLVHGVAMRPGKPVILAIVRGKPVIGLPGYPGAAWLASYLFARPLLYQFQQQPVPAPDRVMARLAAPLTSSLGFAHYLRVRLEPSTLGEDPTAHPFSSKSGLIRTLLEADGLAYIPPEVAELPAGAPIEVHRLDTHR